MASQLLPLGKPLHTNARANTSPPQPHHTTDPKRPSELIDKCVGSRIWVIMKGDKGMDGPVTEHPVHRTHARPNSTMSG